MQLKASKSPLPGSQLVFANDVTAEVQGRRDDFFVLQFKDRQEIETLLREYGKTPLPPYIGREAGRQDCERYQTVYARHPGAVAAPTAGLHFDRRMLEQLQRRGVEHAFITLHVGAGTFQPVRAQHIEAHRLHAEQAQVTEQVCQRGAGVQATGAGASLRWAPRCAGTGICGTGRWPPAVFGRYPPVHFPGPFNLKWWMAW